MGFTTGLHFIPSKARGSQGAVFLKYTAKSVAGNEEWIHTLDFTNNSLLVKKEKLEQIQDYICNNIILSCVLLYFS